MRIKIYWALSLMLFAGFALSLATAYGKANTSGTAPAVAERNYGLELEIHPLEDGDRGFGCMATLRDLETGEVITSPTIRSPWGNEAIVESADSETGTSFRLSVIVDGEEKTARYSAELSTDRRQVFWHKATIRTGG